MSRLVFAFFLFGWACWRCGSEGSGTETAPADPERSAAWVAGRHLGPLRILDRIATVDSLVGPPVAGDSGAGTTVATYRVAAGRDSVDLLAILAFEADDAMHKDLQVVRTTSPYFRDAHDIGVGSRRRAIAAKYRIDQAAGAYATSSGDSVWVYEAAVGVVFELDGGGICRGLAVHNPDRTPTVNYRPEYPEMATRGR